MHRGLTRPGPARHGSARPGPARGLVLPGPVIAGELIVVLDRLCLFVCHVTSLCSLSPAVSALHVRA